jgi:formylglycine-generating enzyme required for sulfatase activity
VADIMRMNPFATLWLVPSVAASAAWLALAGAGTRPAGKDHVNSLGMKLVRIEPGEFTMGTGAEPPHGRAAWLERDADESPAHRVRITRPFYLGAHEVTNRQFEAFDPTHRPFRGKDGISPGDDDPVVHVTWRQAVDFCAWLSKKENVPYRLPTEAEWEYACRAGTTTAYGTGARLTPADANVGRAGDGELTKAVRVGSYRANAWVLFDMHGNVAEWCHDWYGPYDAAAQTDPVGRADGDARVVRGWSFLIPTRERDGSRLCRSANRSGHLPEDANRFTGFRVVLGEPPATRPLPRVPAAYQQNVKQMPAPTAGPDAGRPYFVNFTAEGRNPTIPKDAWGPIFINHNHFSAVCVCPNGDVLACWYTTVTEPGRELAQAGSRLRAGSDRWDPASLFFDVPDVNDHAPVLFSDGKRVYHFCTQSLVGWDNASNIMRYSDDNGVTWSHPRVILSRDDPRHLSQPCSALLTKNNVLVLACDGDLHKDERVLTSADRGRTWRVGKGDMRSAVGKYAIHPAVVETRGGDLLAFLRGPHPMPVARSNDLGDSWTVEKTPFPGIGGGQKAIALRLASGAILLCSIDARKELVGGGTFAALSLDDGKTWPHVRKVDGVGGYMSVAQAPNGVVYLFGSRMGCVAFNEAWVRGKQ